MKRIFLDANVVIDYLDAAATDHLIAQECVQIVRAYFGKPLVSPFTFLIVNFIFGKLMKDKRKHKQQMALVFSGLELTRADSSFVASVLAGDFLDLEDSLQYESALSSKATAILTKDVHDYFPSRIPVVHPQDFLNRHNQIV